MAALPTLLLLPVFVLLAAVAATEANVREDHVSIVPVSSLVLDVNISQDLKRKGKQKRCIFNRQKYNLGEVMLGLPNACADLVCKKIGKKALATLVPREDCTCQLPPRSLFYRNTKAKKVRKCKINGKKVKIGNVAVQLDSNCVSLVCTKSGKRKPVLLPKYLNPCTCAGESTTLQPTTTPPPTEPPTTKPPTEPPQTTAAPVCDYSIFSPTHTMLKSPNADCQPHRKGLTDDEKAEILQKHNELRAKVARGEETQGDPGSQPPAANMRELVWNEELALVAQALSEQCVFGHDGYSERKICSRDYSVGQNLYKSWSFNPASVWSAAIQAWYDEVADMPNTVVASFTSSVPSGKVIGHYTQVVWASTYEVGCGAVYYAEKNYPETKIYVCNYGKAGNFRGQRVYEEGTAASQCSGGASDAYPDLCK